MLNPDLVEEQKLITAFETLTLKPEAFDHAAHVKVGWIYLKRHGLYIALEKFGSGLKAFTRHIGVEKKYHETISWFYVILINERMQQMGDQTWADFQASNPDMMNYQEAIVFKYYSKAAITSATARKTFVLPDLKPL